MTAVDAGVLAELAACSTPSVLNGLKRLGVDPADLQTVVRHAVRCTSPELGVRVGFAATRTVSTRRAGPPSDPERTRLLTEAADRQLRALPGPGFLVAQNVGDWRGPVCIWGDVSAHINLAYGVTAGVTNGPVRDVPEMAAAGFATWADGPGTGGGSVDLVAVGEPVVIGGVRFRDGDLVHADLHGVARVPLELAADLPAAIRAHEAVEQRVIAATRAPDFTAESVARAWRS